MSDFSSNDVIEVLIQIIKDNEKQFDSMNNKIDHLEDLILKTHELIEQIHQHKHPEQKSKNILIVDDDNQLALSYGLILEDKGHKVDTANTGLSALYKMKKHSYDLVILDWNLPDMLGDELADKILKEHGNTEFLFITGYSSIEKTSKYGEDFMLKPVDPKLLIKRVSRPSVRI